MNELIQALTLADEEFFIGLANKGVYKRALKDTEGLSYSAGDNIEAPLNVPVGEDTVTLMVPLSDSKCSCVSRTVCRHIISAMLLVRNNLPEGILSSDDSSEKDVDSAFNGDAKEPGKEPDKEIAKTDLSTSDTDKKTNDKNNDEKPKVVSLTPKQIAKIHDCSKEALGILSDIFKSGMVRLPESIAENIEIFAVRCHTLKMADAERSLRDLGNRIKECIERKSSFNLHFFLQKYVTAISILSNLLRDDLTEADLGVFRLQYEEHDESVTLLPVGTRIVSGGDYEGDIYYFLDMNEEAKQRFYTLSDLRPTFYDFGGKRKGYYRTGIMPWGLSVPIKSLMSSMITLRNLKTNGGKLSSSKDTILVKQVKADINCQEVKNLIHYHYASIVLELIEKDSDRETEQLFFFNPKRCVSSTFDKYNQNYVMILEDHSGREVSLRVHYKAKNDAFIRLLEHIGEHMLSNPEKDYVWLVSAYISGGSLVLYPIDVYDSIEVESDDISKYVLSDKYTFSDDDVRYAGVILDELEDIESKLELFLQCGLLSSKESDIKKTTEKLKSLGLKGLAERVDTFFTNCMAYKHGGGCSIEAMLVQMKDIIDYLKLARDKLEMITALSLN